MKLDETDALNRLAVHGHGVLSTVHTERGVDSVPVVYAVTDGFIGIPIDRVKPKSTSRLQRQRNLEADPRATLLIEHWDRDDWSELWWVRAELRYETGAGRETEEALVSELAAAFDQYRGRPFAGLLVLQIMAVTSWSATAD